MKTFTGLFLRNLTNRASEIPRKRQQFNIQGSYQDACQRLFNAIEPCSYIRPHRHASHQRDELLIAICGSMVLITFDEQGAVMGVLRFGPDKTGSDLAIGVKGNNSSISPLKMNSFSISKTG